MPSFERSKAAKMGNAFHYFHLLLSYPKPDFTAHEFSDTTGMSIATTYRFLKAAAGFNMVTKIGIVRTWQWAANHRPMVHREVLYARIVRAVYEPVWETGIIRNISIRPDWVEPLLVAEPTNASHPRFRELTG